MPGVASQFTALSSPTPANIRFCSNNTDPAHADCSAPQEKTDAEIDAEMAAAEEEVRWRGERGGEKKGGGAQKGGGAGWAGQNGAASRPGAHV